MAGHDEVGASPGIDLGVLGQVEVELVVVLGRARLPVARLLELKAGAVVALDRYVGDPVVLEVDGVAVALGEILVVEGRFGVRITRLLSAQGPGSG